MSAIASFYRLDKADIEDLRRNAVPKKNWLGISKDTFWDFLAERGTRLPDYSGSGWIFGTLLPFLEERGINLMDSDFSGLSTKISRERRMLCFVLVDAHRQSYADLLAPERFSAAELGAYHAQFNNAPAEQEDMGEAMLEAIRVTRDNLARVDSTSIVVAIVG